MKYIDPCNIRPIEVISLLRFVDQVRELRQLEKEYAKDKLRDNLLELKEKRKAIDEKLLTINYAWTPNDNHKPNK